LRGIIPRGRLCRLGTPPQSQLRTRSLPAYLTYHHAGTHITLPVALHMLLQRKVLDWRKRRWFAWYAIVSPNRRRDLGRRLTHKRSIRGLSAVHSYIGSADTMSPFGVLTTLLRGASRRALDSKHGPIGYYKGAEPAHRRC